VSRLPPGLDAPEEAVERPLQPAQRGLLGGERPAPLLGALLPNLLELGGLVTVADADPATPRLPALLQRGVVEGAVVPEAGVECDVLLSSGPQAELEGPPHRLHSWRREVVCSSTYW